MGTCFLVFCGVVIGEFQRGRRREIVMDGGFSLNEGGEREREAPIATLGRRRKGLETLREKGLVLRGLRCTSGRVFFFALQKFPQKISEHKKLKNTARIKKMFCNSFNLLYVCKHIVSISLLKMKFAAKKLCLGNTSPILSSPSREMWMLGVESCLCMWEGEALIHKGASLTPPSHSLS